MNTTHSTSGEDVSGFYGPGALGAWLLVSCSVAVSWMINYNIEADKITNDFLVMLSIPAVAAGHMIYCYIYSLDTAAPWYVCRSFECYGYSLLLPGLYWGRWKRSAMVGIVTAMCFIVTRNTLTVDNPAEVYTVFLVCSALAVYIGGLGHRARVTEIHSLGDLTLWPCLILALVLPWANFSAITALLTNLQATCYINDLDQAVALFAGALTLLYSVVDAVKSLRRG